MTGPFVSQIRLKIKFTIITLIPRILCQLSFFSPFPNCRLRDLCKCNYARMPDCIHALDVIVCMFWLIIQVKGTAH